MERFRRLRSGELVRDMVANVSLRPSMFIQPVFVTQGSGIEKSVGAMEGIHVYSPDKLVNYVSGLVKKGLKRFLIFGTGDSKDAKGTSSSSADSSVSVAVKKLREAFGNDIYIITDVCLCAYTDHGHCGILEEGRVLNDPTLQHLATMAAAHAAAGADMVAPSDMMDGRVKFIREHLDKQGFGDTALMSYAVKYASSYYGPFREAADSAPGTGDRKSYQMDFRRDAEAVSEALTDAAEGADIVMVKPALAYLDIIKSVKENVLLPVAAYNVSGEYSMVKLAASKGYVDERMLVLENMYAMARAGADIIITYHAADLFGKKWLD